MVSRCRTHSYQNFVVRMCETSNRFARYRGQTSGLSFWLAALVIIIKTSSCLFSPIACGRQACAPALRSLPPALRMSSRRMGFRGTGCCSVLPFSPDRGGCGFRSISRARGPAIAAPPLSTFSHRPHISGVLRRGSPQPARAPRRGPGYGRSDGVRALRPKSPLPLPIGNSPHLGI